MSRFDRFLVVLMAVAFAIAAWAFASMLSTPTYNGCAPVSGESIHLSILEGGEVRDGVAYFAADSWARGAAWAKMAKDGEGWVTIGCL